MYKNDQLVNSIYLKNQLLNLSLHDLVKKYQTEKMYETFLDTILVMGDCDSGFFYFSPSSIIKIEEIIGRYRFFYSDKNLLSIVNDITYHFNRIKATEVYQKNLIKEHYLDWHEEIRCLCFKSEEDFLFMLGYDAVSYYSLQQNEFIDFREVPFLGSINYFVNFIPELFQDEKIASRAYAQIDCILGQKGFGRRNIRSYAEQVRENFQKVKK